MRQSEPSSFKIPSSSCYCRGHAFTRLFLGALLPCLLYLNTLISLAIKIFNKTHLITGLILDKMCDHFHKTSFFIKHFLKIKHEIWWKPTAKVFTKFKMRLCPAHQKHHRPITSIVICQILWRQQLEFHCIHWLLIF